MRLLLEQALRHDPRASGPTGSGKTTTLHSALAEINTPRAQDLDRRGPGGDHPGRAAPGPGLSRRSASPSRRPCAPSCAPTRMSS
ncbi:MAG: hypothetical protein MZU95_13805 [Desulfomicrobium escambiense]|nr:hypothetical protein [Desulfomicrobium escambiense]